MHFSMWCTIFFMPEPRRYFTISFFSLPLAQTLAYPKLSFEILSTEVLLTSDFISLSFRIVTFRSFSIVSATFAIVSSKTDGCPERSSSWTSVRPSLNSLNNLRTRYMDIHFFRRLHTVENKCHLVPCFFTHKKRITDRNSHLASKASGNSISNDCQAKTERCRELAGMVICVGGGGEPRNSPRLGRLTYKRFS